MFECNNNDVGDGDHDDGDNHDDYDFTSDSVRFFVLAISVLFINFSAYFLKTACIFSGLERFIGAWNFI
jgi:hypothetical protein